MGKGINNVSFTNIWVYTENRSAFQSVSFRLWAAFFFSKVNSWCNALVNSKTNNTKVCDCKVLEGSLVRVFYTLKRNTAVWGILWKFLLLLDSTLTGYASLTRPFKLLQSGFHGNHRARCFLLNGCFHTFHKWLVTIRLAKIFVSQSIRNRKSIHKSCINVQTTW